MTNSRSLSKLSKDSAVSLPNGTVAQRPVTPTNGMIRYNTDSAQFEGYQGGVWGTLGGGTPLFTVLWWPLRTTIPAGYIAADGQLLSRTTYPTAWARVNAGDMPMSTEANWTANGNARGCYTPGDGSTTFRIPDMNGKSAGTLGAVFLRGDGAQSAGTNGVIQPSDNKSHNHIVSTDVGGSIQTLAASGGTASNSANRLQYLGSDSAGNYPLYAANSGGTEARPLNVTGVWVIKLFGSVDNQGVVDAAQMAADINTIKLTNSGRNRIINGDCRIAQRGSGVYAASTTGYGGPDRFFAANQNSAGGQFTQSQGTIVDGTVTKPAIVQTVNTAISNTTGTSYWTGIMQLIEGNNSFDLKEQPVTVSFLFKTNVTGTFSFALRDSGGTYSYISTFTATANIVTKVIVNVPAIPAAVAVPQSNAAGLVLWIGALNQGTFLTSTLNQWQSVSYISGIGWTNWASTVGNYISLTDLQLEVGTVATPFERRSQAQELALCRRYFYRLIGSSPVGMGHFRANTTTVSFMWRHPVTMRSTPTYTTSVAAAYNIYCSSGAPLNSSSTLIGADVDSIWINAPSSLAATVDCPAMIVTAAGATVDCNAEL